jgi:hypothetical protein
VNNLLSRVLLYQRQVHRGEQPLDSQHQIEALAQSVIQQALRDLGGIPPVPELVIPEQWGKTLAERGIERAAAIMRWRDGNDGWEYPVYGDDSAVVAVRWKAYDSHRTPKYLWVRGKAEWYYLPGIQKAIENALGVMIVANGEPGVLTFLAAQMYNAASFFGEGNIPSDFIARLKAWGVRRVLYFPDRDEAKIRPDGMVEEPASLLASRKLRDVLTLAGIDFDPRELPSILPKKGDTNNLWQACRFDPETFRQTLDSLPPFLVTEPPDTLNEKFKPDWTDERKKRDGEPQKPSPALVQAVEAALGVKGYANAQGWYKRKVKCPFHSDEHPSATWNGLEPRLRCHSGCQKTFSVWAVAKALNIRLEDYR